VGLPHTPPQVSGVGAPQGALEGNACSAALRDSRDAFIIPLYEQLSFLETALRASRRSMWRLGTSGSGPAWAVVYVAGGSAVMVAGRLS